jgi:PST family polysaccharide transporter
MPVGADLWVLCIAGALVSMASVAHGLRSAGLRVADLARGWRASAAILSRLLAQSWRYWVLALLVFFYTGFPVLLIAGMQGDAAAGIFRICLQFAAGLELVFASINSLLLPQMVRWQSDGNEALRTRQREQVKVHMLVGAAGLALAAAAAPVVFGLLLGPQFSAGLVPFIVLALGRVIVFVGQVFVWGVIALRLDTALLVATACGMLASLALNLALIPHYSLLGAAFASVAAETVIGGMCFFFQRRHLARTAAAAA